MTKSSIENIHIENVVATATIGVGLNLHDISMKLDGAEYDRDRFPGLIYRLSSPKTAMLLFESGKIVCTGAKSIDQVYVAINKVLDNLKKLKFDTGKKVEINIQNIVATYDLGKELNLNTIAITLGLDRIEFEPEIFPGLVYRQDEPKVVMLLFGSGKVVCTGAKVVPSIKDAIDNLSEELSAGGIL